MNNSRKEKPNWKHLRALNCEAFIGKEQEHLDPETYETPSEVVDDMSISMMIYGFDEADSISYEELTTMVPIPLVRKYENPEIVKSSISEFAETIDIDTSSSNISTPLLEVSSYNEFIYFLLYPSCKIIKIIRSMIK